jgi:hypothetical protein
MVSGICEHRSPGDRFQIDEKTKQPIPKDIAYGHAIDAGLPRQPSGFGNALQREGDPNFMHDGLLEEKVNWRNNERSHFTDEPA